MHKLRAYLPSANCLFTFEAAARRSSFTAAAGELNVSQSAGSKTIRLLEQALGFRLFTAASNRLPRATGCWNRPSRLSTGCTTASPPCTTVRVAIRSGPPSRQASCNCGCCPGSASSASRTRGSGCRSRKAAMTIWTCLPMRSTSRLGFGDWPELQSWELVPEIIYPVASPAYVSRQGLTPPDALLHGQRLIHFRERNRVRWGWSDRMAAQGQPSLRLDESFLFTDALNALAAASLRQGGAGLGASCGGSGGGRQPRPGGGADNDRQVDLSDRAAPQAAVGCQCEIRRLDPGPDAPRLPRPTRLPSASGGLGFWPECMISKPDCNASRP